MDLQSTRQFDPAGLKPPEGPRSGFHASRSTRRTSTLSFIMTSGGLLNIEARKTMEEWRKHVGIGQFSYMLSRISVGLARARARTFRV